MNILQISTADSLGGAENIALQLHRGYRAAGNDATLAVGRKLTDGEGIVEIPNEQKRNSWTRFWRRRAAKFSDSSPLAAILRAIGQPNVAFNTLRGRENFNFPASRFAGTLPKSTPQLVHCHNLHGGYFDLRVIPDMTRKLPTVLTLHDAWLMSGHCTQPMDCAQWKDGCVKCPHKKRHRRIYGGASGWNFRFKKDVFLNSRVFVAAPSRWMLDMAERSILAPAIIDKQIIANGIDLSIFNVGDRRKARARLAIPHDAVVVMTVGSDVVTSPWRGLNSMLSAMRMLVGRLTHRRIIFMVIGAEKKMKIHDIDVRMIPRQGDPRLMAEYYRAADLYLHASKAESWGLTITEALACGTPVVAVESGGAVEQIKALDAVPGGAIGEYNSAGATGTLVPPDDAYAMASAMHYLLTFNEGRLMKHLSANAAADAARRFGIERQIKSYLDWFERILAGEYAKPVRPSSRADAGK